MDGKAVSEGVSPQFWLSRIIQGRRDRRHRGRIPELLLWSFGIYRFGHLLRSDDASNMEVLMGYTRFYGPISPNFLACRFFFSSLINAYYYSSIGLCCSNCITAEWISTVSPWTNQFFSFDRRIDDGIIPPCLLLTLISVLAICENDYTTLHSTLPND